MDPIKILQNKLSRENIIEAQAEEFAGITEECKNSLKFLTKKLTKNNEPLTFMLQNDLPLILMDNEKPNFELPARLMEPLLACLHLIGHMGASKMRETLSLNASITSIPM